MKRVQVTLVVEVPDDYVTAEAVHDIATTLECVDNDHPTTSRMAIVYGETSDVVSLTFEDPS